MTSDIRALSSSASPKARARVNRVQHGVERLRHSSPTVFEFTPRLTSEWVMVVTTIRHQDTQPVGTCPERACLSIFWLETCTFNTSRPRHMPKQGPQASTMIGRGNLIGHHLPAHIHCSNQDCVNSSSIPHPSHSLSHLVQGCGWPFSPQQRPCCRHLHL